MPSLRGMFVGLVLFWAGAQPALAQQYWDAAQCAEAMIDHVERLEDDIADIQDLQKRLVEAERKGETERVANFQTILESKRVDGIQSLLKRIDEVEYVYCDKSLFDPSLIARVDAARPWADSAEPTLEAEVAPALEIVAITSTFVPFETFEGGSCEGPYLDFVVTIQNRGGAFPRQVDLDVRKERWPTVADTWPYLTLILELKYNNGETGQEQATIMADATGGLPSGAIPSGGAISIPVRVRILDNRTSVLVTGRFEGTFLAVNGDDMKGPVFTATDTAIPIWDLYTDHTETVAGIDVFNRTLKGPDPLSATVKATIINRGGPTPGYVQGNFTVRHTLDGPSLATVSGRSLAPGGNGLLPAGKTIPAVFEKPIIVESHIFALCPDGTPGRLADGNVEDNTRVLEER